MNKIINMSSKEVVKFKEHTNNCYIVEIDGKKCRNREEYLHIIEEKFNFPIK